MRGVVRVAAFALLALAPPIAHADSPQAPWEISLSLGEEPRRGDWFDLSARVKAHAPVVGMTLLVRAPSSFLIEPPEGRTVDMESGDVREYTWRISIPEYSIWHVEVVLAGNGASVRGHVFGATAADTGRQAPTVDDLWDQLDLSVSMRAVPLGDQRVELRAKARPLEVWMGLGRLHADLRTNHDLARFEAPGDKILDYNLTVEIPEDTRTRAWTQLTFAANVSEADGALQVRRDVGCRHLHIDTRSGGEIRPQESMHCDYEPVSVPGPTGALAGSVAFSTVFLPRRRPG